MKVQLAAIVVCLAILAFIIALAAGTASASACHTTGKAPFTAPSNACTPGSFLRKTKADVCDGDTIRPTLPAAERRALLGNYGVPNWTGANGELDHRVPLVLGGVTDRRNVWPEAEVAGSNPKDRLEGYVYRRVCRGNPRPMRVRTAIRIFLGDWRAAYNFYIRDRTPA